MKILAVFSIVLFLAAQIVFGCAPGGSDTGESNDLPDYAYTSKPVFSIKYAPAVGWTYPVSGQAMAGQTATATAATGAAQKAFRTAVNDALKKNGVASTGSYDLNVDEIIGEQINVVTSLSEAVNGSGIVTDNTVLEICSADNAASTNTGVSNPIKCTDTVYNDLKQSIAITNGPLLTGTQWRSVARSLQVGLLLQNAFLTEDIIVSQEK